jgi:hypothetical protein
MYTSVEPARLPNRSSAGRKWRFMSFVADAAYVKRRRPDIFLVLVSVLLVGCHSDNLSQHKPSVQVTGVKLSQMFFCILARTP